MSADRRAWSLLTVTEGGKVSVVRDLTLAECRAVYERLDPWYGEYYRQIGPNMWAGVGRMSSDGDIKIREVFGPEDWDSSEIETWNKWPKHIEPPSPSEGP